VDTCERTDSERVATLIDGHSNKKRAAYSDFEIAAVANYVTARFGAQLGDQDPKLRGAS
jgi:hypothetical protein